VNRIVRSIWTGSISFGMIGVPVKLYTATEEKDISFNQVHAGECGARIKQLRWCPTEERAVEWGEIAKGYEYAKDEYIQLTEGDLAQLPTPGKELVQLVSFVPLDEVDPVFFNKSYYLGPGKAGDKAFTLLQRALEDKGLAGVATIAIRNKEKPCLVRASGGALYLDTLYYPDEIREAEFQADGNIAVDEKELQLTEELIGLLEGHWAPEEFTDNYREQLLSLIDHKLDGTEIPQVQAVPVNAAADMQKMLADAVEKVKREKSLAA